MPKTTPGFTPDTTPGLTPVRRKSEDDLDSSRAHKKPRTRVSYSCGECHRRKQKCDRQIPCSHCIARKVPELCKSYTPGKTDQDIHVRLARLEQIIETALPHYWSQGNATPLSDSGSHDKRRSMSPMDDGNRSQPEEEDPSGGMFESGRWYGKSAAGLVAAPAVLEQLQSMVPSPADSSAANSPYSMNQASGDIFKMDQKPTLLPIDQQNASERLQRLMRDCGYSTDRLQNMFDELPPRKTRDDLIDHYFAAINWTRYPISEHEFRNQYAAFVANEHSLANPNNIRFLPLLFVVLAIAVRLAPDRIGGTEQTRKTAGSRYYWCSRRALLIIAAIQPDCFEIVLTRMLSARFLVLDRRMTESWSQLGAAVRTAQAIGLHRDGVDMGMEPLQVERRRRIWSNLYHADRSIALVLGRPMAIHDNYTSTRPPVNSDEKTTGPQKWTGLPLSQPTRNTFLILRHQLAVIMGRMSDFFQNIHSPRHYADVLALDDELLKYKQSLPPYYSLDPDTSLDASHPYIPLQRFLLVTEFLFVRISLHRPYLLRKLDSTKYSRSRDACFESALKDHEIRQEYVATTAREGRDPVASAYREFQAAMIAGIYVVLYPKGKDADRMLALLDYFLYRHERIPEMDDITRREIKIIEFLKNKSSQSVGSPDSSADHKMAVDPTGYVPPASSSRAIAPRPPHASHIPNLGSSFASVASVPLSSPSQTFTQLSRPSPVQQVRQLQQAETSSNSGSGSPQGEDETAQSLLDQWCNIFSGGPAVDDQPGGTGLPWATPGLADINGWLGTGQTASPVLGPDALPSVDGSDWSYWETLVNQIRSGPFISATRRTVTRTFRNMAKRSRSSEDSQRSETQAPPHAKARLDTEPGLTRILTRILSWNVETPVPFLQLPGNKARSAANTTPSVVPGSSPGLLRDLIRRHGFPDFVCLQEARARYSDKEWISALRLAANYDADVGPRYTMYHSLNRATRGQRHFGVVTFVRDTSAIAAAREVDWDAEGRVHILEMKSGWVLLNVYALNGSEFMWRDPLGQAAPKTRNERKREFNRLLMQECIALQQRGLRVVLIGDFNISLATMDCHPRLRTEYPHGLARSEFLEQFFPGVGVIDIFRELHPDVKAYSWFAKGKPQGADCARVDYALVENCLQPNVVDVSYLEDPKERSHSDHAPLLLTMKGMSELKDASQSTQGMEAIDPQLQQGERHASCTT
ncbi:hypothetical protein L226DRAFT_549800 [Lentinus tigrinus ALCF2SS1-7]|uniref:Zn(2)-C6 fungal-type domain-containing protein n=1 Tax=Lentinus tigrinus ALCF2SS1-6 TaxID=1328759 RepID=A0A5C2T5D8_9APHY|nr:hypothetical protein L227DRAFT_490969 [Lentinus tigrinus ALCF2SS1-6]RPD81117.1 hypothetical protein L226DRAFT_549800 [Lentinus tigrinus ALCF2SS1-7]